MEKSSLGNFRLLCIENLWRFLLGLRLSFSIFFSLFLRIYIFAGKSKFKAILLPFKFFCIIFQLNFRIFSCFNFIVFASLFASILIFKILYFCIIS